jgi:hypothetical protein
MRSVFSVSSNCLSHLSYREGIYHIHYSLPWSASPPINLRMRFLLRGEGCNTLCNKVLKPFIKVLIKHSIKWLIPFWANQIKKIK